MLTSTIIVAASNLLYTVVIARKLGAAGFGDATAIYTFLMLASAVTLSFQLVCSKLVAKADDIPAKATVYRRLLGRAWKIGAVIGLVLAAQSGFISNYFKLSSPHGIVLLAIGVAIYIPLGVQRGRMQGCYEFRRLASNVMVEAASKLIGAALLLYYGLGVTGVVAGIVLSVAIAYIAATPDRRFCRATHSEGNALFGEGVQAAVFFVGQVLISNLDILLVKHYFIPTDAGIYAGVALVGRVVYMLSWSVVSSMFPTSAGSSQETAGRSALRTALLLVVGLTTVFVIVIAAAPQAFWALILGHQFLLNTTTSFSLLLTLYAGMTAIYSVAVVIMAYEISRRIGIVSWIQLGASFLLAAAIMTMHGSLAQVIWVQVVVMSSLLLCVSLLLWTRTEPDVALEKFFGPLQLIRRVDEEEVIAEFLKGEFYHKEFDRYREELDPLVQLAATGRQRDQQLRRALLFRRRGKLWRELPSDTQFWEVRLKPEDVSRVRAFPRNDWRRFARGSFYFVDMIERIRRQVQSPARDRFLNKLRSLEADLKLNHVPNSLVLIAQDERSPLTLIEGNHRMAAAMLLDPGLAAQSFRFYCGFSPAMKTCCWYESSFHSLARYIWHRIRYAFHDGDEGIVQFLQDVPADAPPVSEIEAACEANPLSPDAR